MSTGRAALVGACLLGGLALNACLPSRVIIDLAPSDGTLEQRIVMSADGSPGNERARGPRIALIDVRGVLSHESVGLLISGGPNPVDALVARLYEAEKDPGIVGVVLRINSPGGTVAASETMYEEIRAFRQRTGKPVVASMAEIAASGGYYIALAADTIVAQESSTTGSIGVIVQTFNVSDGLRRIGITARAVTSDEHKDLASPFKPMDERDYAILRSMVDRFHASFTDLVAERRPALKPADMPTATDGRVFTGAQAAEIGLVDELGGLREAFARARTLSGHDNASLVKFVSHGSPINTAYAMTHIDPAGASNSMQPTPTAPQLNLLQLNLSNQGAGPSAGALGFYYLWAPNW